MSTRALLSCLTILFLAAIAPSAVASPRASLPAETMIRDTATRVSVGHQHTCRAFGDGSVRCWGVNFNGQLGDGTTTNRLSPVVVGGISTAVAVVAAEDHSCALLVDGSVKCWGQNGSGELGDGTQTRRLTPVNVSGLSNVVAIAAGRASLHTCALIADGTVKCWGFNFQGQLGDGTTTTRLAPVAVSGLAGAVAIAVGSEHSCALLSDGTVQCWGNNAQNQLGNPIGGQRTTPVFARSVVNATAIAAGNAHTCALIADGTMRCWGANGSGQLGDGTNAEATGPGTTPIGLTNVAAMGLGGAQTCALAGDGTVRCWGENSEGQLGDGTTADRNVPASVSGFTQPVTALVPGDAAMCALLASGALECWGRNVDGQYGNGTTTSSLTPVSGASSNVTGVIGRALANGSAHSCAVRDNGSVACWGDNGSGQLGTGNTSDQLAPRTILSRGATAVAAGARHTCVLLDAGTVSCTGANGSGQLGIGNTGDQFVLRPVGLANVVGIATGSLHTCAVLADGTVRCWGANANGQLGDDTITTRVTPVRVLGVTNAVAITAGAAHSCALLSSGGVRCWGQNTSGQLGDGTLLQRVRPVVATGVAGAVEIAAGNTHTCALITNGTVRCWGGNSNGQLGDGTTTTRTTSVAARTLTDAISIAAGGVHSCAVSANAVIRCWGDNAFGQIGDGTTTDRPTPTLVTITTVIRGFNGQVLGTITGGITHNLQVAAGGLQSCALRVDGGVLCWGDNGSGQLGTNNTTDQTQPTEVPSFTLNIEPDAELANAGREVRIELIAVCEAGAQLHARVSVTQGGVSGSGEANASCTGFLADYPLIVRVHGNGAFAPGAADAQATAFINGHGVSDQQEWTRTVAVSAP